MSARRLRAVLFDLDDTLVDHSTASRLSTADVLNLAPELRAAGVDAVQAVNSRVLETTHLHVAVGRLTADEARVLRWREVLEHFGADPSLAEEIAEAARAAYRRHHRLVDGVPPLLEALRDAGLTLGIVSNSNRAEQVDKLQRFGIDGYFAHLALSADHGFSKPDPRLFASALAGLGVEAVESVYVGDKWEADVVGALASGIRPVWFNRFGLASGDAEVVQLRAMAPVERALQAIVGEGLGTRMRVA